LVHIKPPFGEPQRVLKYLARYTHRVAISNHRLRTLENGCVSFEWKNRFRTEKLQLCRHLLEEMRVTPESSQLSWTTSSAPRAAASCHLLLGETGIVIKKECLFPVAPHHR
jgi:hypothetical protein